MQEALYDSIGIGYTAHRRADPRIERHILSALGDCTTLVNVGAGAGSYEPDDRWTVAVEPSWEMIRQRDATPAPAIRGDATRLPFRDGSFDAAMAVLSLHHWPDWRAGLLEMARVAACVVVLTFDPPVHNDYWLFRDYLPEVLELPSVRNVPRVATVAETIGADSVTTVMVPPDCSDGFASAYWRRPERYLDAAVRRSISALGQLAPEVTGRAVARLQDDLQSGEWHERNRQLLGAESFDGGMRLIVRSKP